jgi:hypothetical protein
VADNMEGRVMDRMGGGKEIKMGARIMVKMVEIT